MVFDLDGTLLDRDTSLKHFISSQYKEFAEYLSHIPEQQFCSRFIEIDNKGYVWKDKVYQLLIEEFQIEGITVDILLQHYIENFKYYCIAFPHLLPMLKELKEMSLPLGIITNGKGRFQLDNINALKISSFFDVILVSELEGLKKPDAPIFHRALERLKVAPQESLYIGDHPINDIDGANLVGMHTIWKKDLAYNCFEADFIINDLSEIPLIIRTLSV